MAKYATEQKKMLLEFFKNHAEEAFTVEELAQGMKAIYGESAPGVSTVYRLVTGLREAGDLRRFVRGNSRHFVYQMVDGEHCHSHLHLRCTACGRLLHLDESLSEEILRSVRRQSAFTVSEGDTVLLGCCQACAEGGKAHG